MQKKRIPRSFHKHDPLFHLASLIAFSDLLFGEDTDRADAVRIKTWINDKGFGSLGNLMSFIRGKKRCEGLQPGDLDVIKTIIRSMGHRI